MFRSFEAITADIGTELKETAKRIYTTGMSIAIIIAVLTVLGGFISAISYESFDVLLICIISAGLELLIALSTLHLITINLYARGEIVHLLKGKETPDSVKPAPVSVSVEVKPATAKDAPATSAPKKKDTTVPVVMTDGTWMCPCGKTNASYVSSCSCGRSKWDS